MSTYILLSNCIFFFCPHLLLFFLYMSGRTPRRKISIHQRRRQDQGFSFSFFLTLIFVYKYTFCFVWFTFLSFMVFITTLICRFCLLHTFLLRFFFIFSYTINVIISVSFNYLIVMIAFLFWVFQFFSDLIRWKYDVRP